MSPEQQNEVLAHAKQKGLEAFASGKVVKVSIPVETPATEHAPARRFTTTKVVRSIKHLDKLIAA